jgi:hypothetical protein
LVVAGRRYCSRSVSQLGTYCAKWLITDRRLWPLVGDRIGNYPELRDRRDVASRFAVITGSLRRGMKNAGTRSVTAATGCRCRWLQSRESLTQAVSQRAGSQTTGHRAAASRRKASRRSIDQSASGVAMVSRTTGSGPDKLVINPSCRSRREGLPCARIARARVSSSAAPCTITRNPSAFTACSY